ncbi:hypothetical protein [Saccharicrinis aurantiacus]|uniref:hypothetical protein n=1 Tax=Saccharicrinis aurantiacus TaxID=1849719 RepID=UPI00094FACD9|nr:hypothetical protein [Saccharicrinis aurantiacus]
MKFQYLLLMLMVFAVACEPLEDIQNELDNSYTGPVNEALEYDLVYADYKNISERVVADATTEEEAQMGAKIQEDTLLFADVTEYYIARVIEDKVQYGGYAVGSMMKVNYRLADNTGAFLEDTYSYYLKNTLNSWAFRPDAGYEYDFEDGTDYEVVDQNGWGIYNVGGSTDREWAYRSYGGNRYAQISAYGGEGSGYEAWMVSPELDLDNIYTAKNIKFESAQAYDNGATLKVYVLDNHDPKEAKVMVELEDVIIASSSDNNYTMIPSGDIDISEFSGKVFIGFLYTAEGDTQTTTYQVDNFVFDYEIEK